MANFDAAGIQKRLPDDLIMRNAEAISLLQAARSNRYGARDFVLLALILRHGLSVRALIGLRPRHLAQGHLVLEHKSSDPTRSRLHPSIKRMLPALIRCDTDRDSLLFQSQLGGPIKRQTVNYIVETTSQKAGVAAFSPTELRHLCGYNLAAAGHSKAEINVMLGLSGNGHVNRYFMPWS